MGGWSIEIGNEQKERYLKQMKGIERYLPDYLKLDIWSYFIDKTSPRYNLYAFLDLDNGEKGNREVGYVRQFNFWLSAPARSTLRERFGVDKIADV